MQSIRRGFIALAISSVLTLGWASWGAASEGEADTGIEACGHLDEMAAAKQALVDGDKDRALEYLRAARALLVECEREAEVAADPSPKPELGRDLI